MVTCGCADKWGQVKQLCKLLNLPPIQYTIRNSEGGPPFEILSVDQAGVLRHVPKSFKNIDGTSTGEEVGLVRPWVWVFADKEMRFGVVVSCIPLARRRDTLFVAAGVVSRGALPGAWPGNQLAFLMASPDWLTSNSVPHIVVDSDTITFEGQHVSLPVLLTEVRAIGREQVLAPVGITVSGQTKWGRVVELIDICQSRHLSPYLVVE